jgi:hypothetical protein
MSTRQLIGTANQLYAGRAFDSGLYGVTRMKGRPVSMITKVDLGTPKLAVAAGIVNGATGATEAPSTSTITFTAATQGDSPLDPTAALGSATIQTVDGARTCMVLDVPRNVTAAINTAVGTLTVTVTGYDQYRSKMVETLSIAPGGTAATGKKAFKYIWSVSLTSTANDSAKAINVGFGAVLGLPYRIAAKSDLLSTWFDDAVDSATVVAAVATTPSATTGDVRGTITIAGTLDGAKTLKAYLHVSDSDAASRAGLLGVSQFAG